MQPDLLLPLAFPCRALWYMALSPSGAPPLGYVLGLTSHCGQARHELLQSPLRLGPSPAPPRLCRETQRARWTYAPPVLPRPGLGSLPAPTPPSKKFWPHRHAPVREKPREEDDSMCQ